MRRRLLQWPLSSVMCFLTTLPVALHADDVVDQSLVARMSAAVRSLDYQGSFIYEHNGQIDALRLFHAAADGDGKERERLVSLSGAKSELLRDGATISSLRSGMASVIFPNRAGARLLPLVPDTRGLVFGKLYTVSEAGEDRVAGYPAHVIDIVARDGWRYGYRLWLADDTQMLLRSAVVDAGKRPLEQYMFVALEIGARPKESDLASSGGVSTSVPPDEMPLTGPPRWRVADLPPGFTYFRGQQPAQGPTQTEHHMYTDGIANVSVYVEQRDPGAPGAADGALNRGMMNVYVHTDGDWRFTAIGDVPRATVEKMARSVAPVEVTRASAQSR